MKFPFVALSALLLFSLPSFASAQKKRKPTPKPGSSRPAQKDGPIVLGTNQLPGEFGQFGKDYTIGTEAPLNVNLLSAEYRADRFLGENNVGEAYSWVPLKNQKLLVIKYTVQNPNNRDTRLWYNSFQIIAVSADDQNSKILNHPWIGNNTKYEDVQLKPAQKVTLTAAILVPAQGEVPKLIIQRSQDDRAAVVRYDLRGKVKKIADSMYSENGIDANEKINVPLGTYFAWSGADIQVNGVEEIPGDRLLDMRCDRGQKFVAIKLKARGVSLYPARLWYGMFDVRLSTSDGETVDIYKSDNLLRGGRDEKFDGKVPVGEEQGLRLIARIPKDTSVTGFTMTLKNYEEQGRIFKFTIQ